MVTQSSDIAFVPKVWSDHIMAHWERLMVLGQFALRDTTLTAQPGETVNFPYFKLSGEAEELTETQGMSVNPLTDDAFSVTVKEVGIAYGDKKKTQRKSAASVEVRAQEMQRQMGLRLAEKIDKDLLALLEVSDNYDAGFVGTTTDHKATVANILTGKISGFGDKQSQAIGIAMHSYNFLDLSLDIANKNLLVNSNEDPFKEVPGFQGRILGMAIFTLDTLPRLTDVSGKRAYASYVFKPNPFGISIAEEMDVDSDKDILHREMIVAATQWYGVTGLHKKVATTDKRVLRNVFVSSVSA